MLCQKCEKEIPENNAVCSYCGTSVSHNSKTNPKGAKKRSRKKNAKNNITHISKANTSPEAQPNQPKPEISNPPQPEPEIKTIPTELPQAAPPAPQPEIPAQPTVTQPEVSQDVNISFEKVKLDSELPKADNKNTLPDASGIIYEIAEELYYREKADAEIEALCRPPFKKVFSDEQLSRLNEQARADARDIAQSAVSGFEMNLTENKKSENGASKESNAANPISTAKAFWLQLVLMVPILNIILGIAFSFNSSSNLNIRAYSRAFLVWCIISVIIALATVSALYFTNGALWYNPAN